MFVHRRGRRRLPALLGRGMADDGRAARPTVNMVETWRSPTRAGTRRDVIRRRGSPARDPAMGCTAHDDHPRRRDRPQTIRHTMIITIRRAIRDVIRHQTIPHATIISYAVPGDRAIRHAMIISHSRISAYVCVYLRMSPIIFSGVMSCHFSHSLRLSSGAVARWCGGPVA